MHRFCLANKKAPVCSNVLNLHATMESLISCDLSIEKSVAIHLKNKVAALH